MNLIKNDKRTHQVSPKLPTMTTVDVEDTSPVTFWERSPEEQSEEVTKQTIYSKLKQVCLMINHCSIFEKFLQYV